MGLIDSQRAQRLLENAMTIEAEIARRLAMPYARELVRNADGSWFGRIVEFPG